VTISPLWDAGGRPGDRGAQARRRVRAAFTAGRGVFEGSRSDTRRSMPQHTRFGAALPASPPTPPPRARMHPNARARRTCSNPTCRAPDQRVADLRRCQGCRPGPTLRDAFCARCLEVVVLRAQVCCEALRLRQIGFDPCASRANHVVVIFRRADHQFRNWGAHVFKGLCGLFLVVLGSVATGVLCPLYCRKHHTR
jgi:hypothetical protein